MTHESHTLTFGVFLLLVQRLANCSAVSVAVRGLGLISVGPFPPMKWREQIYVSFFICEMTSLNSCLPQACNQIFDFSVFNCSWFFCHSVILSLTFPGLGNLINDVSGGKRSGYLESELQTPQQRHVINTNVVRISIP